MATHREKSLTPWLRADGNHEYTKLPAKVYDAAVHMGCDMKWFKRLCTDNEEVECVMRCAAGCYITGMGLDDMWRKP